MRKLVFVVGAVYSCLCVLGAMRVLPGSLQASTLMLWRWFPVMLVAMGLCCFGPVRRTEGGGHVVGVLLVSVVLLVVSFLFWLIAQPR